MGGGALFLAVLWSFLLFCLTLWRVHWRILHVKRWWDRECPRCHTHTPNLKRIHRTRFARWLNSFAVPARSYICGNCHWQGVRIDETKV
jgi:hypothetical protein